MALILDGKAQSTIFRVSLKLTVAISLMKIDF
jgi:hypothetical protein